MTRKSSFALLFFAAVSITVSGRPVTAATFTASGAPAGFSQQKPGQKPNIIYILTDDLGYGDVGVFFQQQRQEKNDPAVPFMLTPYLDKMAQEGAVLDQYCAAPVCAPSRASVLLGVSQGHANVRDNQFDKALEDNYTLGNVMQKAGYATAAIGKWGLQGKKSPAPDWTGSPLKRGFDYYYGYIAHGHGHEHYPKEGLYRKPKPVWENTKEVSAGLDNCYTGDLFTALAKKYIVEHQEKHRGNQPFFLYLAYDTPHAVLELPTQAYPEGKGLKGGLRWTGTPGEMINTASGKPDSWMHPDYAEATYDHDHDPATPEVAWPDTYKRYATVVRRIDSQVGDILQLLKDLGIAENTLVVFTSDNGPSKESYLPKQYVEFTPSFFNGFGPFDGIKRDVWEGGVRMPAIAWWPGHIAPDTRVETPSISYDWMPTFAAMAGLPAPVRCDGVSLLPSLTGKGPQQESLIYIEYFHPGKTPAYPEFDAAHRGRVRGQMQLLRWGDTLGIRYNIQSASDDFEIYDIAKDPGQTRNLASQVPASLQKKLKARVLQARMPDPEAPRPYDDALIPAVGKADPESLVAGLSWTSYKGNYPWLANVEGTAASRSGVISAFDFREIKAGKDGILILQGYIRVPEDGAYTFSLRAGGKAFLRIHDAAVIDADYGYRSRDWKNGKLLLKKGLHPVKIYYSPDATGKPGIELAWKGPSFEKKPVPNDVWFH